MGTRPIATSSLFAADLGEGIPFEVAWAILAVLGAVCIAGLLRIAVQRERRLAKAERDQQREWLQVVLASIDDGVITADIDANVTFFNPAAERLTGWRANEALGRKVDEVVALRDAQTHSPLKNPFTTVVREGRVATPPRPTVLAMRGGVELPIDQRAAPILGSDGQLRGVVFVFRDISERQKAEHGQQRLAAILQTTTDFVGTADLSGRILYLNRAARRLLGIGEAQELGEIYLSELHPAGADEPSLREGLPAALRDGTWSGQTTLLTPDGRHVPASQVIVVHRRADETVEFISTILRDLSEHRRLEDQLRQAQKMEAVGRLAGGIAHDFNNLLTAVTGYSSILLADLPPGTPSREHAEQIRKAGERAAQLTRQLLAFGRRQFLQPKVLDLNVVVADLEKMLRRVIGEDIELVVNLAPGLGRVKADPGQIEQVLMNLVVNARDAMPEGGRLTLSTENAVALPETVLPGRYVVIQVADTGSGMSDEVKAHLFEPFFTTKEVGKGTGLGLATVYGIVKQSAGHIEVESELGQGSTFRIYLPRANGGPEAAPKNGTRHAPHGRETVLLVEDEDDVRRVARQVLEMYGYTVLEARSGADALDQLANHPGSVGLLISDVVMPGMGGTALLERLRALRPRLKALFVSGHAERGMPQGMPLLHKPFTPEALACKVREVLDQEQEPAL